MNREEYEKMYRLEDSHWWYVGMRQISRAFLDGCPKGRAWRVLDAGCGTGGSLALLEGYGRVYGVDLALEGLAFCRLRGWGRISQASVSHLPFANDTFDLVTSFDVLYHQGVQDDVAVLREFRRVLKVGGTLLVRVPALDFLRGRHDIAVHTRHRYWAGELTSKVREAGLALDRVTYANSLLLPLALAKRALEGKGGSGSDLAPTPQPFNRLLTRILALESIWLAKWPSPIGLSLFALAHRPAAP